MTLYQLGTKISASLELSQVLGAVAEGAREMLVGDIGLVGLLDKESQEVVVKAVAGARTEALKSLRIPVKAGALSSALASGWPFVVEEYSPDQPLCYEAHGIASENIVSFLVVPLERDGCLLGLMGVMTRQRRHFSDYDAQLLVRLAHYVAVTVENAQLYQQVRNLAVLEERDRLARELHDHLAQALGYLNVKISITSQLLSNGQLEQARASLLELKQIVRETYTDVRETIFSLRTTTSSGLGLLPTLREYLAEYRTHYGVDARLVVDNENAVQFSPDVDIQLLCIVQEALTNVRKHAKAKQAWIRFERGDEWVQITIEDDGQGFDLARVTGEGRQSFGLQIMCERAESVGGNLNIDSWPGKGTRVVIRVPLMSRE